MVILKVLIWVVQIISAFSIVILVLLQHGKGADAGVTFGSGGGSGSLFGASGAANFLSRTTAVFAAIFFITTFANTFFGSNNRVGDVGVMAALNGKMVSASGATGISKNTSSNISASKSILTNKTASNPVKNEIPN